MSGRILTVRVRFESGRTDHAPIGEGFVTAVEFFDEVIDLLTSLLDSRHAAVLQPGAASLAALLIRVSIITESQAATWASDPDACASDLDEDMVLSNVRAPSVPLLLAMSAQLSSGATAVLAGVQTVLAEADAAGPAAWRLREAALLMLGALLPPALKSIPNAIPVAALLSHVLLRDLADDGVSVWRNSDPH
jgi:hypothetical protein